jgi:hypothetical protein
VSVWKFTHNGENIILYDIEQVGGYVERRWRVIECTNESDVMLSNNLDPQQLD